ncbi:MAG: FHA domain-containing protein [Desertifilum sp. SIO1I2]|nr:FHA domain-containing protein [Desertifilum sp. SIO1I2]
MLAEPVCIQLSWQDPETGELQQPTLQLPIALGRELEKLPTTLGDRAVSRVVLNNKQVSRFHALIDLSGQQIIFTDRSANGTLIQKQHLHHASLPLAPQDRIEIGPYHISIHIKGEYDPHATEAHARSKTQLRVGRNFWTQPWVVILLGTALALLMGFCSWLVVTQLLRSYRPQVPLTSPENRN